MKIPSGEYALIRTEIAFELPHGTYDQIATRTALATHGLEVGAGVIDQDFRGEIKVLLHNRSGMEFWMRSGDQIAELIVEKVMEVQVTQMARLSTTARGSRGLEHTNADDPGRGVTSFSVANVRRLGRVSGTYEGGSSATNGETTSLEGRQSQQTLCLNLPLCPCQVRLFNRPLCPNLRLCLNQARHSCRALRP